MGAILVLGVIGAGAAYVSLRAVERERARDLFAHRAALRCALAREVLGRYEDALFGLSAPFMLDARVSPEEFRAIASRLRERIPGVQAFEWVPWVPHANRAALEEEQRRAGAAPDFAFADFAAGGHRRRAEDRADYFPILYVEPLRGNEAAHGYDLKVGPTWELLARAREQRQMLLTPQIRLVQETGDQLGAVMILPVYRAAGTAGETFAGYLQCVFRVEDLLETAYSRQPTTILDTLFVDRSETDPAKRVLFYRPAAGKAPRGVMREEEFRRGLWREFALPFGQRDWRVIYRPHEGWHEAQLSFAPLFRAAGMLALAGLVAGLVHSIGRRAELVRREVQERTVELAESRRQLAAMLHALPGMAFRCTYDDQLTILFLSEGARELTGWTAEEFLSGAIHFRDCIHPDDLPRVRDATRAALHDQKDIEVEYRIRTKSGQEKWVLSRGRGAQSADGRANLFEGLAIDITAQKEAEGARLALERKLLEGQKLESLGLLAGGIAHDFNNLLSSVLGNASMARLTLPEGNPADSQLRAIEAASLRAAELCRQMLAYAGKGRFVVEHTDLTALVEDLLPLLKISIAHQAKLQLNLARNLPPVLADATQLRQIVMNLVLNAVDAIAAGGATPGEIVLATGVVHADQALLSTCAAGAGLTRGDYVFLEVRDNGTGMAAEVKAKIFDPFFTTKFAGRGLGLAAVLGIVRGHNGALSVESAPSRGSAFRLMLPPVKSAAAPSKSAEPAAAPQWERFARVLVVEDEGPVRTVLGEMLKTFELTPTLAASGREAVALFEKNPFDLVVLDLLMPGMSGEQTLAELRRLKPDVRVLLISGYSESDVLGRLGGGPGVAFLAKPFKREALERKLRDLLG